jgi:hypothetical protein
MGTLNSLRTTAFNPVAFRVAVKHDGDQPDGSLVEARDEIEWAEGEGFEPPRALRPQRFSSPVGLGVVVYRLPTTGWYQRWYHPRHETALQGFAESSCHPIKSCVNPSRRSGSGGSLLQ